LRPYTVVTDEHLLAAIAREIESADVIGLDLETAKIGGGGSFDPLTGRVRLCSVNTGQGLYIIDLYKTKTLGPVVDAFRRTKGVTVGQNMKFDQKWLLWHFDLEIGKLFDTLRASSIIYAGLPGLKHDLWSLYKRELGEAATVEDLGGSDWDGTLTQRQLDYAADDIDKLPRLRDVLKKKIVDARLVKIAQLEFNAVLPEACMELNGFFLNKDMWLTRTASDRVQLERLRASLLSKLPNPSNQLGLFGPAAFNLDSTDQLLRSLGMLGVKQKWKDPETGLTKTVPLMDTKEMTLAMEADRWPILKEVIEYRGYAQSVKAFGEEYLKNIHPTSGRIHSSYFPFTDTGRYANRGPNLQQVPRGGAFRDCFRAEPGRTLAICDWSNIEMRIVAEISKDPVLIKVFRDDRDAHYATASLVTGKPESEIVKAERQQAKPVNFGFIYGMQAARLVMYAKQGYGVSFTENQARTFRRRFFEAYAGIDSWHRLAMDSGKRQRETRTAWGRRRIIKDEKAHNEFYNSPIQGTGADGLKVAIRNVYDRMKKLAGRTPLLGKGAKCAPVHMVHDEIVCEHDEDPELEIHVRQELHDGMIEGIAPMLPSVPTRAEVGGGRSWASKS
jgi:DNA polymerase-1